MVTERPLQGGGQHRHPVLVALPGPDDHFVAVEVEVLDPEPQPLQEPHPRAEQQTAQKARDPAHLIKEPADLPRSQDHRQALGWFSLNNPIQPRQFNPEHPLVQEEQGSLRLVLSAPPPIFLDHQEG
jgi:hypothetical protein